MSSACSEGIFGSKPFLWQIYFLTHEDLAKTSTNPAKKAAPNAVVSFIIGRSTGVVKISTEIASRNYFPLLLHQHGVYEALPLHLVAWHLKHPEFERQ